AQLCRYKQYYAAAARFYRDAFAAQPNLTAPRRYDAACFAALAGCGQGKEDPAPGEKDRARLRNQALAWLRADLTLWERHAEDPKQRAEVRKKLQHWQGDPDLAGVRGAEALAKLPEEERQAWQQLWKDVAALLSR